MIKLQRDLPSPVDPDPTQAADWLVDGESRDEMARKSYDPSYMAIF